MSISIMLILALHGLLIHGFYFCVRGNRGGVLIVCLLRVSTCWCTCLPRCIILGPIKINPRYIMTNQDPTKQFQEPINIDPILSTDTNQNQRKKDRFMSHHSPPTLGPRVAPSSWYPYTTRFYPDFNPTVPTNIQDMGRPFKHVVGPIKTFTWLSTQVCVVDIR